MRPRTPCQFQTAGFLIEICFTDFLGGIQKVGMVANWMAIMDTAIAIDS